MTSAPVRDVMYGMESVSHANTAKKTETAQEKEHDFRMIMNQAKNQAKQTVHQPNEEKVERKIFRNQKIHTKRKTNMKRKKLLKRKILEAKKPERTNLISLIMYQKLSRLMKR